MSSSKIEKLSLINYKRFAEFCQSFVRRIDNIITDLEDRSNQFFNSIVHSFASKIDELNKNLIETTEILNKEFTTIMISQQEIITHLQIEHNIMKNEYTTLQEELLTKEDQHKALERHKEHLSNELEEAKAEILEVLQSNKELLHRIQELEEQIETGFEKEFEEEDLDFEEDNEFIEEEEDNGFEEHKEELEIELKPKTSNPEIYDDSWEDELL